MSKPLRDLQYSAGYMSQENEDYRDEKSISIVDNSIII